MYACYTACMNITLPIQPIALASHTAVLVGGAEMMVVIGGVREDLSISSRVMVYRLRGDQWEVWETNILDMPGRDRE